MALYRVTLSGPLTEGWRVDAASPAEAVRKVRDGQGEWLWNEWDATPTAEATREVEVA